MYSVHKMAGRLTFLHVPLIPHHSLLTMPRPSLSLALLLSLLLHLLLIAGGTLWQTQKPGSQPPPAAARLDAYLHTTATLEIKPAEALLKNTLADEQPTAPPTPATPPKSSAALKPPAHSAAPVERAAAAQTQTPQTPQTPQQAQRKLAAHTYYPAAAIERGLQGEVHVLLLLHADGQIVDASIAASSGHPILDQAALEAVAAMGSLPGMNVSELLLPVSFQLQ